MRIWKIISGLLSIAIAALVAFPSFFSELLHITGQATGGAGMAVAAMLLAGGIISIAASRGSMAADIALICLYGLGSLVGFTMAGTYDSLLLWALWCLLCAALAVVDFFVSYFSDDGGSSDLYQTSYPDEAPAPSVPTLRSVILEHSPKKREAVIDALPERDAKSYLKQVVTALINRAPILPPELEDDEEPRPGRTALIASACTALVFIAGIVIFLTLRGGAQSGTPTPSAAPSAPAVSAAAPRRPPPPLPLPAAPPAVPPSLPPEPAPAIWATTTWKFRTPSLPATLRETRPLSLHTPGSTTAARRSAPCPPSRKRRSRTACRSTGPWSTPGTPPATTPAPPPAASGPGPNRRCSAPTPCATVFRRWSLRSRNSSASPTAWYPWTSTPRP